MPKPSGISSLTSFKFIHLLSSSKVNFFKLSYITTPARPGYSTPKKSHISSTLAQCSISFVDLLNSLISNLYFSAWLNLIRTEDGTETVTQFHFELSSPSNSRFHWLSSFNQVSSIILYFFQSTKRSYLILGLIVDWTNKESTVSIVRPFILFLIL